MKPPPPPPSVIRDDQADEPDLAVETVPCEEIKPTPTRLLSFYIDVPPVFPDLLVLLGLTILSGVVVGVCFASFALMPLSFEGTFWCCVLHTLLFSILFFSMRVTNFPILFTISLAGSCLAVLVGHLYTFMIFRSIFLSSEAGLNAKMVTCIVTYLINAPNIAQHAVTERHLFDWVIILAESIIMAAAGAISPFCVWIMHEKDDSS